MNKITVKVVDVDYDSKTLIIKFASDQSARPIDDYQPIGFQLTNPTVNSFDEFVASIREQLAHMVYIRDLVEQSQVDIEAWIDQTAEVSVSDLVLPNSPDQQTPNSNSPEVLL